jgi:hypothetical protein|nr:MAG TPA: hypothetical protein [Caudoviricetes sp.]
MDAVEFLKERSRMYKSGAATPTLGLKDVYDPVIAVKAVEEWSAAHPRKTRQSVFLEQWPNCMMGDDDVIRMCPRNVDKMYVCNLNRSDGCCTDCRRKFWKQVVE